jgi:hypothetical protein
VAIIPEVLLQRAIVEGFRNIRKDSRVLDTIFKNLHQDQLEAVKEFILKTSIDFSVNYPRKDLRVPSFVLLLKNEAEAQTFLGDVMGGDTDQELTIDTLGGHGGSVSSSKGIPRKVAGPIAIEEQTDDGVITFQEPITELVESFIENNPGCLHLYVTKGAGVGKIYTILRIRENGLDIEGVFDPQLDSTSVVDIRKPNDPELSTGEPSRIYDPQADRFVKKGVNYDVTYHIHVIAGHQDEVIYLYALLKALLLMQRSFLESQGIMALRIGGSDFAPRTEYLPTEAFQRMMTLQFVAPFSFIESVPTIKSFSLNILPEPVEDPAGSVLVGFPIQL